MIENRYLSKTLIIMVKRIILKDNIITSQYNNFLK